MATLAARMRRERKTFDGLLAAEDRPSPRVILATCHQCGAFRRFEGATTRELMEKIDDAGWRDRPADGGGIEFTCAECEKKQEEALRDRAAE